MDETGSIKKKKNISPGVLAVGTAATVGLLGVGAYTIAAYNAQRDVERVVNLADVNIVDILATIIHLKKLIPFEKKDLLYQTEDSIRQLQEMIKATKLAKTHQVVSI